VDGDGLLHRCASAVERELYLVTCGHEARQFDYHKDAKAFVDKEGGDLWHRKDLGSETLAADSLDSLLAKIQREVACPLQIYIGGLGPTFRHSIARLRKYKDGRKEKPAHYSALRTRIIERYGAVEAVFEEADDVVSYTARSVRESGNSSIIVSNDKDLDQIPGPHYDWTKGTWRHVSPEGAVRALWVQTLSGDATDGIPGCWKIGPGKAETAVSAILEESREIAHIWECVVATYEFSKTLAGCPYADVDAALVAQETHNLVRLKEFEDEWPEPIDIRKKSETNSRGQRLLEEEKVS
jgi:hypothetical protein